MCNSVVVISVLVLCDSCDVGTSSGSELNEVGCRCPSDSRYQFLDYLWKFMKHYCQRDRNESESKHASLL